MRTELLLKRDNGDRVKITAYFSIFGGIPLYITNVDSCKKGKRTWVSAVDTDCFRYRATPFASPERELFAKNLKLNIVTEAEINQAKIQLWESLHPSKQANQEQQK